MNIDIDFPAKVIEGVVTSSVGIERWPYNDGRDPFWRGGSSPKDYRWRIEVSITQQTHSSYKTRVPFIYDGNDVSPGDWIADQQNGMALRIISIVSKTPSSLVAIVEDAYRYNTFRSPGGQGAGIFAIPSKAVIFTLNKDGLPVIDPVPPSGVSANFYPNIMSRFQDGRQMGIVLRQRAHGFSKGQLVSVAPEINGFTLTDTAHPYIIGSVADIDLGPDDFVIQSFHNPIERLDGIVGDVGDLIYPDASGGLTTMETGAPIAIKIKDAAPTVVRGYTINPTTIPNKTFKINGFSTTIGGTGAIGDMIAAINAISGDTGVVAAQVPKPSEATTVSTELAYGEPILYIPPGGPYPTATINGTTVTFTSTRFGSALYQNDYAVEMDMAYDINEAGIPNITAIGADSSLKLENATGGAITIVNGQGDRNNRLFAGFASGSGLPLSTPALTGQYLVALSAADARPINVEDVNGSALADFGITSGESGDKAAALFVVQGVRASKTTPVPSIVARDALSAMSGDMAFVTDKGNGKWGLFLFNGTVWNTISTQESAETNANTVHVQVYFDSDPAGLIDTISGDSVISIVSVEVLVPFDNGATISIGTDSDPSALMDVNSNDLSGASEYKSFPSFAIAAGVNADVKYFLTATGATQGHAVVAVQFS